MCDATKNSFGWSRKFGRFLIETETSLIFSRNWQLLNIGQIRKIIKQKKKLLMNR
jgi:hypothetical protein